MNALMFFLIGGIVLAAWFVYDAFLTEPKLFAKNPDICGGCGFRIGHLENWHRHYGHFYHAACCPRCRPLA